MYDSIIFECETKMHVVDLFIKLLSHASITPDDDGLLEFIADYLEEYEAIWINKEGVKNLFLHKRFGEGPHLCFAGHVDVVPPGKGWNSNPFVPKIDGERIYARGAQDMKSGVAAFVQALKECKEFDGTLSLLLTSDEEGDALYGTKAVLEVLKEKKMLPGCCVVAEPTCEERFGDAIKIGRRGSINGVLTIRGKQGHAAYPEKAINPVHLFAPRLPKMAGYNLDSGDAHFAPSKIVITDIRGGMQVTNVTPSELKIMFNVRNSTKTDKHKLQDYIEQVCEGLEYELRLTQGSVPFLTDQGAPVVTTLVQSIQEVTGVAPKFSTSGGTSDARFFAAYGVDVAEFGVINDTIHAANENTTITQVEGLYRVFSALIQKIRH